MLITLHLVLALVSFGIGYGITDHTKTAELNGKEQQVQFAQLGEHSLSPGNRSSQIETVWELSADRVAPNNEIARCGIGE